MRLRVSIRLGVVWYLAKQRAALKTLQPFCLSNERGITEHIVTFAPAHVLDFNIFLEDHQDGLGWA
jgi:hypothetical protein